MTREEAIQFLDNMKHEEAGRAIGKDGFYAELIGYHIEALNIAIKALEHPERNVVAIVPCEDAISRQAMLDGIDKLIKIHFDRTVVLYKARQVAENLPSVQSERKTGHWVEIGDEPYDEWECDVCGFVIDGSGCIDPEEYRDVYRFCPNCGADMRGEQDG